MVLTLASAPQHPHLAEFGASLDLKRVGPSLEIRALGLSRVQSAQRQIASEGSPPFAISLKEPPQVGHFEHTTTVNPRRFR